jgi:hypothetical protein
MIQLSTAQGIELLIIILAFAITVGLTAVYIERRK